MRTLSDYSKEELARLPYPELCQLRRRAWAAHVATMTVPTQLQSWAAEMTRRHGPKVQVWSNALPWLIALLVVRYGEDAGQWPPAFSPQDVARAEDWQNGQIPNGVTLVAED